MSHYIIRQRRQHRGVIVRGIDPGLSFLSFPGLRVVPVTMAVDEIKVGVSGDVGGAVYPEITAVYWDLAAALCCS